jgi:SNF2 family DNA or RNA helicase
MLVKKFDLTIPGLKFPLFDFQKQGVVAMYLTKRVVCGSQTGLGKSVMGAALLTMLNNKDEIKQNEALIICPNSMREDWFRTIKKFTPLKPLIGKTEDRNCKYLKTRNNVLILGYSTIPNRMELLKLSNFKVILCDESSYLKNVETKLFQSVSQLTNKSERLILLNATTVENSLLDFYSASELVQPGFFGGYSNFLTNYCSTEERFFRTKYHTIKSNIVVTGIKSLEAINQLKQMMSSFYFRHEYKDCEKELPEAIIKYIPVVLKESQKKEYLHQIELFKDKKIKGSALLYRLLRVGEGKLDDWEKTDKPEMFSSKAEAVIDLVQSFGEDPFIIFSPYIPRLLALGKVLRSLGKRPGFYTGINVDTRENHADEFIKGERNCLLLSVAGARGKNFSNARHMIMFSQVYNPSLAHQIHSRIRRIDSLHHTIFIHNIIASETIEERVLELLERKGALACYVNEDGTELENISDAQISLLLSKRESLINADSLEESFNSLSAELAVD